MAATVVAAMAVATGTAAAHNRAGRLDVHSFNQPDGFVTEAVLSDSSVSSVLEQRGGRIVAVGNATDLSQPEVEAVAMARYERDGTISRSFGVRGVSLTPVAGLVDVAAAMQQGPVRSYADIVTVGSSLESFFAVRHDRNGRLDRTFGTLGRSRIEIGELPEANGGAVQPDGKIVVVGTAGNPFADTETMVVARFLADGGADPSFGGGDGFVTLEVLDDTIGFGVAVQRDGRIVAVGQATRPPAQGGAEMLVARFLDDGSLDPDFGDGAGYVTLTIGFQSAGFDVAFRPDGKIVVSGTGNAQDEEGWALAQFDSDGSLDEAGFGDGVGWVVASPPAEPDFVQGFAASVTIQRDGTIVAVGPFGPNLAETVFTVGRFLADGAPDPDFGTGGFTTTAIGSFSEAAGALVQRNGKIVVGGETNIGGIFQFAVARYLGR